MWDGLGRASCVKMWDGLGRGELCADEVWWEAKYIQFVLL
jgi:hypothetical protein